VIVVDCIQGSPEWAAARIGKITASNMEKIISPTGQESKQADKYMNRLIAEVITGQSEETFAGNAHTERGNEFEQEAADYYATLNDWELQPVGFCLTDDGSIGCSPDRFIGDDGMLEIKTGLGHIFIESALNEKLEQEHRPQTQAGLLVTGRQWVDTMLYHPRMKKQIIIRSVRNEPYIAAMQSMVRTFQTRMQERINLLQSRGYLEAA
jgi:hypothetical protein